MATCVQCGKSFDAKRSDARYCSSTCRVYAVRARRRAEQVAQSLTLSFEGAALLEQLRRVMPKTAASVEKLISDYGVECAVAAVKVALTAAAESGEFLVLRGIDTQYKSTT